MVQHIKTDGVPVVSKLKDEFLERWQKRGDQNAKNILTTGQYKEGSQKGSIGKLNKHLINEIFVKGTNKKISGKCCQKLKKDPIVLYEKKQYRSIN